MQQFVTRAYNNIVLNKEKGTVTKTSKESRLLDEINFYKSIPQQFQHFFPKLIDSGILHIDTTLNEEIQTFFLELEYYPFQNLYQFLQNNPSVDTQKNLFKNLMYLLDEFSKFNSSYNWEDAEESNEKMLIHKTDVEYQKLKTNFPFFTEFCKYTQIKINNSWYDNFERIWPKIIKYLYEYKNYSNYITSADDFGFIHGDFCWSNILIGVDKLNNTVLKLIDPRGSYGQPGCIGNRYYDLAKFSHSVSGRYEDIIYDNFSVKSSKDSMEFQFNSKSNHVMMPLTEIELYSKYDKLKIKLIEGTIFIGMCARHMDSLDRQKVMYATGIKILNECLEEIKQ